MIETENLLIYKSCFNLIYYSEMILEKFPKLERNMLVKDIREECFDIMRTIIKTHKEIARTKKIYYLNEIDIKLKLLKVFVRLSYKKKYITSKNYGAWSRKITAINNLVFKWLSNV